MTPTRQQIPLDTARAKAIEIVGSLIPFCQKIEIAGSIRRERPFVHDIDLVVIPRSERLADFKAWATTRGYWRKGGTSIWTLMIDEIQVDVYFATDSSWATMLLIRTGSAAHNIWLCQRAASMGLKLHASGRGLEIIDPSRLPASIRTTPAATAGWLPCNTEEQIFAHLQLPYRPPASREIPAPGGSRP